MTSFSPDAGTELGTLIAGKYRVDGVIGEGGMGKVLRATHMELERTVAIKVIRSDLAASTEVAQRMLFEARAAASITNEHVVRVLDVGRMETGAPFIVMEHLTGMNLYAVLQERGPMPMWQAVDWLLEACEALAEAHALGLVHRDMKPENLFLASRADGTPTIKVLDFGVSKRTSADGTTRHGPMALTNPSTAVGSPHYMAPEQMRARADVDGRADIYSLGAILFELLTGRPPFDADTIPMLCTMVLSERPPTLLSLRSELPNELDTIIQRCLAKTPDERYWSISELARAVAPFGSQQSRESVHRVIRVLGESPPPASQRAYQLAVSPDKQTLAIPARSALPTPVTSSGTVQPPKKRGGLVLALSLLSLGVLAVIALLVLAKLGREAPKPLERALANASLPSVQTPTTAVVPSVSTEAPPPEPTVSVQPTKPPPVTTRTPPHEPKPPPSGTSDTFGGRK